jgi:hypothetical protein
MVVDDNLEHVAEDRRQNAAQLEILSGDSDYGYDFDGHTPVPRVMFAKKFPLKTRSQPERESAGITSSKSASPQESASNITMPHTAQSPKSVDPIRLPLHVVSLI